MAEHPFAIGAAHARAGQPGTVEPHPQPPATQCKRHPGGRCVAVARLCESVTQVVKVTADIEGCSSPYVFVVPRLGWVLFEDRFPMTSQRVPLRKHLVNWAASSSFHLRLGPVVTVARLLGCALGSEKVGEVSSEGVLAHTHHVRDDITDAPRRVERHDRVETVPSNVRTGATIRCCPSRCPTAYSMRNAPFSIDSWDELNAPVAPGPLVTGVRDPRSRVGWLLSILRGPRAAVLSKPLHGPPGCGALFLTHVRALIGSHDRLVAARKHLKKPAVRTSARQPATRGRGRRHRHRGRRSGTRLPRERRRVAWML